MLVLMPMLADVEMVKMPTEFVLIDAVLIDMFVEIYFILTLIELVFCPI